MKQHSRGRIKAQRCEILFLEGGWLSSGSGLVVVPNSGLSVPPFFHCFGHHLRGLFSWIESFGRIVGDPAGSQVVS